MRIVGAIVVFHLAVAGPVVAANRANDLLQAQPSTLQALYLGQAVGKGCTGRKSLFMGIGKSGLAKDEAFWSLQCSDGRRFLIRISPDTDGSTSILDCALYEALKAGRCFEKFK